MNLPQMPEEKPHENTEMLVVVDATSIALQEIGRPITNTVLLGALLCATGWVKLETILETFKSYFSERILASNSMCVKRGYNEAQIARFGGE